MNMIDNNDKPTVEWHNDKGKFKPGNPGKLPGTHKNKLRDDIKSFMENSWQSFPDWFAKLDNEKKIDVMLSLFSYVIPRMKQMEVTVENTIDTEALRQDLERRLDLIFSRQTIEK